MIIPTPGRLVLQKIKEDEKPQGLLIVPNQHPKQDRYRVVSAAGDSKHVGITTVYIDKYKGVEITHEGQVYLVVSDDDVVAYEATGQNKKSDI